MQAVRRLAASPRRADLRSRQVYESLPHIRDLHDAALALRVFDHDDVKTLLAVVEGDVGRAVALPEKNLSGLQSRWAVTRVRA